MGIQLMDKLVANLGTCKAEDRNIVGETLTLPFPEIEDNVPSTTLILLRLKQME